MFCFGYGIYTRERDCNFLSSSYGDESHKSVGYGKYTTLNMARFSQLIGRNQKEVGGSWAKLLTSTLAINC